MKKKLLIIFVLLFVLNGCAKKPDILRIALDLNDDEWVIMREKIFPDFERKYKIKIEAIQVESQDLFHLLSAIKKSKDEKIDLFSLPVDQIDYFVKNKMLEEIGIYTRVASKRIISNILTNLYYGDRLYCMPLKLNVYGFYCDDKRFLTSKSLKIYLKKYNKQSEQINLILPIANKSISIWLYEMLLNNRINPYKLSGRKMRNTFFYIKDIWPYVTSDSIKADLENGYYFYKPSKNNLIYAKFDIDKLNSINNNKNKPVYFCVLKSRNHFVSGIMLSVAKGSKNKRNAIKFIEYLYSKGPQKILYKDLKWIPLRSDVVGLDENFRGKYEFVFYCLRKANFVKDKQRWEKYDSQIEEVFTKIILKNEPIQSVLRNIKPK